MDKSPYVSQSALKKRTHPKVLLTSCLEQILVELSGWRSIFLRTHLLEDHQKTLFFLQSLPVRGPPFCHYRRYGTLTFFSFPFLPVFFFLFFILFLFLYILRLCLSELYAGIPFTSGGILTSSSPQDPVFTATSAPPSVAKGVNNSHIETNTSLRSVTLGPISDSNTLSEARSVDTDMLDLGLSLLVQPSSLGEGSSLAITLGVLSPLAPR